MDDQNNLQNPIPEQPLTSTAPRSTIIMIILLCLLMLGIGLGGGYFLFANKTPQTSQIPTQKVVQVSPTAEIITENSPTPIKQSTSTVPCRNKGLGVQIMVPKEWTCQVDETASSIIAKSSLFNVGISNLGRGLYCGGTGEDPTCKTSEFYKNEKVNLILYTSNGVDGEIFGEIKTSTRPFMWIKYEGMDKRKLTTTEKNEIIRVIESLTFTK